MAPKFVCVTCGIIKCGDEVAGCVVCRSSVFAVKHQCGTCGILNYEVGCKCQTVGCEKSAQEVHARLRSGSLAAAVDMAQQISSSDSACVDETVLQLCSRHEELVGLLQRWSAGEVTARSLAEKADDSVAAEILSHHVVFVSEGHSRGRFVSAAEVICGPRTRRRGYFERLAGWSSAQIATLPVFLHPYRLRLKKCWLTVLRPWITEAVSSCNQAVQRLKESDLVQRRLPHWAGQCGSWCRNLPVRIRNSDLLRRRIPLKLQRLARQFGAIPHWIGQSGRSHGVHIRILDRVVRGILRIARSRLLREQIPQVCRICVSSVQGWWRMLRGSSLLNKYIPRHLTRLADWLKGAG